MKYFAKVENDIVTNIIVSDYALDSSYIEYSPSGEFRKKCAMVGGSYNKEKDIFIDPQPYESWILNENDEWQAPSEKPEKDGFIYVWNESLSLWEEFEIVELDI